MIDHDYQPSLDPNDQGECIICGGRPHTRNGPKTYTEGEVKALIAAAYLDAANKTDECWMDGVPSPSYRSHILTLTPADAKAALDRRLQAARNDALREAADLCPFIEDTARILALIQEAPK